MLCHIAVLGCALLAFQAIATSAGAEARAAAFLKAHNSQPDLAELNDFAKQDPNGYALVKALVLKKSMGLLDPRKPTASFAVAAPQDDDQAVGAAAFSKFAVPGELSRHASHSSMVAESSATEEAYSAPVSHSEARSFGWKPNNNDDDMVASVLGQVSAMTGQTPQGSLISQNRNTGAVSALSADDRLMRTAAEEASGIPTFDLPSSDAPAQQPVPVATQATPRESSTSSLPFGLPSLDWGSSKKMPSMDEEHAAVAPLVTPALHLVPVEGVPVETPPTLQALVVQAPVVQATVVQMPVVQAPVVQAPLAQTPIMQRPVKHASASFDNSYLSGIDLEMKAPVLHLVPVDGVPAQQQPVVPSPVAQASANLDNPYLAGVDFGAKYTVASDKVQPRAAPLDFTREMTKISGLAPSPATAPTVTAAKPRAAVALSAQSQQVKKGSYLADIAFSGMLAPGASGFAANRVDPDLSHFQFDDEVLRAAPVARAVQARDDSEDSLDTDLAMPAVRSSLRKSASMIKESTITSRDFDSSPEEVLGNWLHRKDSGDVPKPAAPAQEENPYMVDLS